MKKWEYKTVFNCTTVKLCTYGKDGWELVAVRNVLSSSVAFYFKREVL
jgi:hypothetical protein